jgi:hypothetical protein
VKVGDGLTSAWTSAWPSADGEADGERATMMSNEREELRRQRMEADFVPNDAVGGQNVLSELRVAHALEYIAYQMGQINRNLARIAEKLDGKG